LNKSRVKEGEVELPSSIPGGDPISEVWDSICMQQCKVLDTLRHGENAKCEPLGLQTKAKLTKFALVELIRHTNRSSQLWKTSTISVVRLFVVFWTKNSFGKIGDSFAVHQHESQHQGGSTTILPPELRYLRKKRQYCLIQGL
jgi:hypothetical protein